MALPCYKYQALPQEDCIRLLYLSPGTQDETLSCYLLPVPLSEAPHYETISYVWGKNENLVRIDCGAGFRFITPNLADVLRQLRLPNKERKLWADAVCINQDDDAERSHQVSMMGLIYWHATCTLIWLGRDDTEYEDENGAMIQVPASNVFKTIQKTAETVVDEIQEYDSLTSMPDVTLSDLKTYDTHAWGSLALFLQRPWFHRAWVIQEIGLAADSIFFCGTATLSFFDYLCFARWFIAKGQLLHNYFGIYISHQMIAIDYWFSTRTEPDNPKFRRNFLSVLASGRGVQCTDPKDYVYAFLGHPSAFERFPGDITPYLDYEANFKEKRATIVSPDYNKSVAEIDTELAKNLILHMGTLEILSYVNHGDVILLDHPSWAPRWYVERAKATLTGYYTTSLDSAPIFRFKESELHLRGRRVDIVEWVTPIASNLGDKIYGSVDGSGSDPGSNAFRNLWNVYRYHVWQRLHKRGEATTLDLIGSKPIVTPAERSAFLFTLTAGQIDIYPAEEHFHQFEANVAASGLLKVTGLDDVDVSSSIGDASRFLLDIQHSAENRALFCTSNERIGIGPLVTEASDECWVFAGATVPFLLRKIEGEEKYRIVGEAYIHGIMRGELFREDYLEDVVLC